MWHVQGRVEVGIGFWWGNRRKSNHLKELGKIIIKRILIMKPNEMHYFSNLFDKVLYMFRTSPLSIIRGISTLHTRKRYL